MKCFSLQRYKSNSKCYIIHRKKRNEGFIIPSIRESCSVMPFVPDLPLIPRSPAIRHRDKRIIPKTVNYRTGGLDITASFWAGRYGHSRSLQKDDMYYLCGQDVYEGYTNQETKNVWKGWSPQLQINYMVDNNHSHLQGKESQP